MAGAAILRAGIYSRESKDKTKSIDDQAAEGREAAEDRGWEIVAEYSDGTSASRFGRKVRSNWQRLLADLDAGALDVVVAWEPSRADRDLETWVTFVGHCRERGVLIHLSGDDDTLDPRNPSHWHRLINGGLDAAMESEKVSRRTRRGTARAAQAGKPHGPAPYGYERVIVGEKPGPHGPRPVREQRRSDDAAIVVEVFERIARNDPITAVARDLTRRGVRSPGGGRWTRDAVREMVRNPAYAGIRRHRSSREGRPLAEERYDGIWPALVEADLFHRAQAVLARPDRVKTKPGGLRWMLSYLASAPCGGKVRTVPETAGRPPRYVCHEDGCVSLAVSAADEVVSRIICARLARADVRSLLAPSDVGVQQARNELADLRARLEQHYDEASEGRLSAGGLAAVERRLLPQIADAETRARPAASSGALADLLTAAEFGATQVRPTWDGLPVAGRREVITALAVIVVGKTPRALSRWATEEARLAMAAAQLGGSRWVGAGTTWAEAMGGRG